MRIGKRLILLAAIVLLLRGFVALGANTALDHLIQSAMGDAVLVEDIVARQSSWIQPVADAADDTISSCTLYEHRYTGEESTPTAPIQLPDRDLPIFRPGSADQVQSITLTGGDDKPANAAGITVRNGTTFAIDVETLLNEPLSFDPSNNGTPTVLILHTHGTESFEPDGADWYDNVDNYRTNDMNLNITRVGREVAEIFEARGIRVIHSQTLHDYPSFRGSYSRSLDEVEWYLAQHPEIDIVIDIHRDAIMDLAGNYLRTDANIPGINSAQVMLVIGTDHAGLYHPHWRENLKFALRLQAEMVAFHPTFARPLSLREERFNAHVAPGAILVEIGACGNTLQEALTTARIFAELTANVILGG